MTFSNKSFVVADVNEEITTKIRIKVPSKAKPKIRVKMTEVTATAEETTVIN